MRKYGPEEYEFCEEMLETYQVKLDQINRQISVLDVVKYRLEKQIMQMTDKRRMRNGNSLS